MILGQYVGCFLVLVGIAKVSSFRNHSGLLGQDPSRVPVYTRPVPLPPFHHSILHAIHHFVRHGIHLHFHSFPRGTRQQRNGFWIRTHMHCIGILIQHTLKHKFTNFHQQFHVSPSSFNFTKRDSGIFPFPTYRYRESVTKECFGK